VVGCFSVPAVFMDGLLAFRQFDAPGK